MSKRAILVGIFASLREFFDPDPGPHPYGAESMIAMSRALQAGRERRRGNYRPTAPKRLVDAPPPPSSANE